MVSLIGRDGVGKWGQVHPPFRTVVSDLMDLLDPDELDYVWGPFHVGFDREFFTIRQGEEGIRPSVHRLDEIGDFIAVRERIHGFCVPEDLFPWCSGWCN